MIRFKTVLILIVFLSQSVWALSPIPAKNIDLTFSGSWYNQAQSGHGLSVEVLDDNTTVIFWYVYDPDGSPVFLITVGENENNITSGDTFIYSGMKFGEFDTNDVMEEKWGTVSLTFYDCDNAELTYSSLDPQYGSGSIPMTRYTSIKGIQCTNRLPHGNYSLVHREWKETGETVIKTGYALLFANGDMVYALGDEYEYFPFSATTLGFGSWLYDDFSSYLELNANSYSWSLSPGPSQVSSTGYFKQDGFSASNSSGLLEATFLRSFQNNLTTRSLEGTYSIAEGDILLGTLTIASDGKLTGSVLDCQLEGEVQVPDTSFNQGNFYFDRQNCDSLDRFSGAIYKDGDIKLIGNNQSVAIFWSLF